ncbi:hypothetical protein [Luteolibacter sp. AS25]|uniref:hypothetical protein n=1 Tax=Luteolibacter sp. AS25 TaxID=3135776 RepID=UPI00398B80EE
MRFLFFNFLRAAVAGLLVTALYAGPFVGPADVVPPFRRDLLPISVNTMIDLSKGLTVLPQVGTMGTAEKRRAVAQALALALALDPENKTAREFIRALERGETLPEEDSKDLTMAKARIWQVHAWLETEAAGKDGNLLAALMGDSLSVLDAGNPLSKGIREGGDKGRWEDWVAPLSDFKVQTVVKNEPQAAETVSDELPDEPGKKPDMPGIKLGEGRVESVSFQRARPDEPYQLAPVKFSMKANGAEGGEEGFRVKIDSLSSDGKSGERIEKTVNAALMKIHGAVPERGVIRISADGLRKYSYKMNGEDISGAAFLLAESAISGKGVNTAVIGKIDGEGKFVLPDYFWGDLEAIQGGDGGRLILPAEAYEYLMGVLVLEKPEFFLKYEVLLARDAEELIRLARTEPSEEDAEIFAKFAEIRKRSKGEFVWSFLANTFVRQRLEDLAKVAPFHASAKLLAIQGAGGRPRVLSRKLLAAEILRMIDPVEIKEVHQVHADGGVTAVQVKYEELRERLSGLERYTDSQDQDLLSAGQGIASTMRDLARAASKVNYEDRFTDTKEALDDLKSRKRAVKKMLSEITGDPVLILNSGE